MKRRHRGLVFVDAIGITSGYKPIWLKLLAKAGITEVNTHVTTRSSYQHISGKKHLEWKKTRKQPGFNTDPTMQRRVESWVDDCVAMHKPDLVICFDPALLFLLNPDWSQATLDKLRGGLYIEKGIPWVVTLPLTAYHSRAKSNDIAKLNEGFVEKGEFEDFKKEIDYENLNKDEDDDEDDERDQESDNEKARMEWHEPVIIPFGKIVLGFDLAKVGRLLSRIPVEDLAYADIRG